MVLKNPDQYEVGKTIVYFVRHGDRIHVPNNKEAGMRIPGLGLSALGKKQAKYVAKQFSKIKNEVDIVYCSTMARARETAEEISRRIKKKPIQMPEFCEFNQFLWKGKYYHPKFWKHLNLHRASIRRLDEILKKHQGKVILIVAHGNIIKGFVGNKLGLNLKQIGTFDYHNCHISRVRFNGNKLDYISYFNSKELV